ncbi:MAG: SigE family RNA polymerase sigma factor [Motilibacteraceae bacterium]
MREAEFTEFAAAHAPALRRLAYGLTGRWDRADDLVQGALERTYSRWPTVRRADDPGAYVRRILVNLASSEGRRPWRRHELSTDLPPEPAPPQAPTGPDAAEQVGQRLDLARALAGLTVKQRAVVVLRFYEDRSVEEVAAILGIAEGTDKRQTWDALRRLRFLLPDHEPDAGRPPAGHPTSRSKDATVDPSGAEEVPRA